MNYPEMVMKLAGMAELVDAVDSKSTDLSVMWVRFPLPAIDPDNPWIIGANKNMKGGDLWQTKKKAR